MLNFNENLFHIIEKNNLVLERKCPIQIYIDQLISPVFLKIRQELKVFLKI
jgi:hypothetical protein